MANPDILKDVYAIRGKEKHWYYTLPYGFRIKLKSGKTFMVYLPINPSNISIQTQMATNIVTTLNGVVEEHSNVRFHDITIQGTTGYMPQYYEAQPLPDTKPAKKKDSKGLFDKALDTVTETATDLWNKATNKNQTSDKIITGRQAVDGNESKGDKVISEVSAVFPKTTGIIKQAIGLWQGSSSIRNGTSIEASGYIAFHNLQRALLTYKKDISSSETNKNDTVHPIQFVNLKDNMQYDCAPIQFNVTRSAESPMLYNYSITFRGYNLRSADQSDKASSQSADQLAALGLSGYGNTIAKSMKSLVGKGMSTFGAIRSLGR